MTRITVLRVPEPQKLTLIPYRPNLLHPTWAGRPFTLPLVYPACWWLTIRQIFWCLPSVLYGRAKRPCGACSDHTSPTFHVSPLQLLKLAPSDLNTPSFLLPLFFFVEFHFRRLKTHFDYEIPKVFILVDSVIL